MKIIERPTSESTAVAIAEDTTTNALIEVFKEDYENITDNPTDYISDLVVRTFCPLLVTNTTDIDVPK